MVFLEALTFPSLDREMIAGYVPEMIRLTRMVWQSARREPDDALHRLGNTDVHIAKTGASFLRSADAKPPVRLRS
jgi:hypothetical protein